MNVLVHVSTGGALLVEDNVKGNGDVVLLYNFWDCNCEKNYINSILDTKCENCGAHIDDCANSRMSEWIELYGNNDARVVDWRNLSSHSQRILFSLSDNKGISLGLYESLVFRCLRDIESIISFFKESEDFDDSLSSCGIHRVFTEEINI